MSSITLSATGTSSIINVDYFPAIELNTDYELVLLNFETYNSIPNITEDNNKFYYINTNGKDSIITCPSGSYEIKDIEEFIQLYFNDNNQKQNNIKIRANLTTLKCEIYSSVKIDFSKEKNIGSILGFNNILENNKLHESTLPINIFKVNTIRILCNLTTGAYINDKLGHSIYEFSPDVAPGYKISIIPNNLIYFPITVKKIHTLNIIICDQNDEIVNFRKDFISIRLHLRPIK